MIGIVLTGLLPDWRIHYAPIDDGGLAQYRFLERLGFFGVELGTTRGSMAFLRMGQDILSRPESTLWITAQGEFTDIRERPVRLKAGVGHLVSRSSPLTIIPLALEYPFWNDRCPEALAYFGKSITSEVGDLITPRDWTARIAGALQDAQDLLAEESRRRDPSRFATVIGGANGIGGIYDLWRRFRAKVNGEEFDPSHHTRSNPSRPRIDLEKRSHISKPDISG